MLKAAAEPEVYALLADGGAVYREAFRRGLAPDPKVTVSEWADSNRVLSRKASAEPGPWRTSRVPYMREVMDCLSPDSGVETTILKKGSQIAGTEALLNFVGYATDSAPGPMLVVMPTVETAKRFSRQRLDSMIEATPNLRDKVAEARSRDSGNSTFIKEFPGGLLILTGANSAVGLRSMPIRYLACDEIDAYPPDVDGEGDPIDLAKARTRTFRLRRKHFFLSSPTIEGRSAIDALYQASDQRQYHVPCPACGHFQVLVWSGFQYENQDPKTVRYACKECGTLIPEHEKTEMLAQGKWIPKYPERSGKTRGYHLSAFYSPLGWYSWEEATEDWRKAQGKPDKLRVWTNTVEGECWAQKGEAPKWEALYNRRESYPIGTVPMGGLVLTAGADVQKDRIEVEVVAWGPNFESWSVDYIVIPGDPFTPDPYKELDLLLARVFPHESGAELRIRLFGIDSSYATQHVYSWARRHGPTRVLALKGRDDFPMHIGQPKAVDVEAVSGKKRSARGVKAWPVGTSKVKEELYAWLNVEAPTDPSKGFPPGWCHIPGYGEEYFRQLTAEQIVVRMMRGHRKYQWEKTRERNEALDTRVYARAASVIVGVDRWSPAQWKQLAAHLGVPAAPEPAATDAEPQEAPPAPPQQTESYARRGRQGGWLDRWHGPRNN